jgi:hypothetical protein
MRTRGNVRFRTARRANACLGAVALALCAAGLLRPSLSLADDSSNRQAAFRHFQRAVTLYGEADYRAALVEFKRAYALAPNPAVLYNVGEAQYQLQDYAGALTTFEHFLAEASSGDGHRTEVEGDVEVLRARVGHISLTTVPPGAEIAIDDQPTGKTPLDRSLLVSIGRRKVVASLPGRPAVTRFVDVAADDNLTVTLQLPDAAEPASPPPPRTELPTRPLDPAPASHGGSTLRFLGWTATGVLAAGAVTSGILGLRESHDLEASRAAFPASSETLNREAQLTTTYSIVADSLAAAAIVVGGITLFSTWMSPSSSPSRRGSATTTQVVLGPASARVEMTF